MGYNPFRWYTQGKYRTKPLKQTAPLLLKILNGEDIEIISFTDGENLNLIRSVSNSARVDLDTNGSYTVIFIQDGVSKTIKINGGSSSVITIRQSQ